MFNNEMFNNYILKLLLNLIITTIKKFAGLNLPKVENNKRLSWSRNIVIIIIIFYDI